MRQICDYGKETSPQTSYSTVQGLTHLPIAWIFSFCKRCEALKEHDFWPGSDFVVT